MRLYSVTEVLGPYSDFSSVPEDKLLAACDRGTAVHRYCAAYARGVWAPEPGGHEGYCESFRRWFDRYVVEVISTEQEYRDEQFGFIAHPDIVCITEQDGQVVPDYKTPLAIGKTWELQLAAYRYITKSKKAGSLRLHPEGKTPKMDWIPDDPKLFNLFLSALNLRRYFDNGGRS